MSKTGISYYNSSYSATANMSNGKFASTFVPSMALQLIPITKSYGYESLTHGKQSNGVGYFPIMPAYPLKNGRCPTVFKNRACTGQFNPVSCMGACPKGQHCCFDGPNCAPYINKTTPGTCISGASLFPSVPVSGPPVSGAPSRQRPGNPFIARVGA